MEVPSGTIFNQIDTAIILYSLNNSALLLWGFLKHKALCSLSILIFLA
jgi:hypothetical protein